jgi:hypothetical protein
LGMRFVSKRVQKAHVTDAIMNSTRIDGSPVAYSQTIQPINTAYNRVSSTLSIQIYRNLYLNVSWPPKVYLYQPL